MTEQFVTVPGAEICVETVGDPAHPALLLLAGMGWSMDFYDPAFCARLAEGGRFVVRYDHRDAGRSTASPPGSPGYTADDLTTDPLHVLDALGVERAHLLGVSMGAGIAQSLAAVHPGRLRTATLVATTAAGSSSATDLPGPEPRVAATFDDPRPAPGRSDREAAIAWMVEAERPYAGGLGFDEERVRRAAATAVDRGHDPAAAANHALVAGGGPEFAVADLRLPVLVVHGTDDPLFPLPHGEALAAEVPGADLLVVPGMGHEAPPPAVWDLVVPRVLAHTGQAGATARPGSGLE